MYKPCCILKAAAVSCTCLTGSLRYCQKQNIRVCLSLSKWPVKPFIRKPLHQRTSPATWNGPTSWMLNGLQTRFLHSWLFSEHTLDVIEFTDFLVLYYSMDGGVGLYKKLPLGVLRPGFCPGSAIFWLFALWASYLTFWGPPLWVQWGREGWNKWSPVTPLSSKRQWQAAHATLWKPGEHMELFN